MVGKITTQIFQMRLVVDTNIIFSMLLKKNSKEWSVILREDFEIFIPKFLVIEIFKHKEKIIKLSGFSEDEILEMFYLILKYCAFFNEEDIGEEIEKQAFELVKDIDQKDAVLVGSALALNAKLWSGDKKLINGLKHQHCDFIVQTKDLF